MKSKILLYSTIIAWLSISILRFAPLGLTQEWALQLAFNIVMLWSLEIIVAALLGMMDRKDENQKHAQRVLQWYMLMKFIKLLVTAALVGFGILLCSSEDKRSLLIVTFSTVGIYMLNLFAETLALLKKKKIAATPIVKEEEKEEETPVTEETK